MRLPLSKHTVILAAIAIATVFSAFAQQTDQTTGSAYFDWSNPQKLSPHPFSKPTSSEPSTGEFISNVIFENNGVLFTVHDEEYDQPSPARFYYSYLTGSVELRANYGSVITVSCPPGCVITAMTWDGAKTGKEYLSAVEPDNIKSTVNGSWGNGYIWKPDSPARTCCFFINSNINCSSTRIYFMSDPSSVDDITVDDTVSTTEYFTPSGISLGTDMPASPGMYILRHGRSAKKVIIR